MSSFWEGLRRAAATGAARATQAAELAMRRIEIQRELAAQEARLTQAYAALGQALVQAVRSGATPPPGVTVDLASLDAAEAEVARLRAALAALAAPPSERG
jgi:hypothetical protein